ncbi:HAD family hydrolase [Corynebacterium gerontici]|uniref:Phosphorylated carbohydrates phosphatase n=1 Tax=Corynebacterium gerontici TaxID=2079234 RepID=A0A3G6J4V0_9CORY|nr:HAD family phosphatase [Corynebacterium gerontici]AZA11430.1 Phosphorylated carbohydrates phosphatase [Corynebacterium gerontici]
MFNAIVWDMDGTLVDSEPLWAKTTYAMSEAMGKRIPPELQARTVGAAFPFTVRLCAEHAGIKEVNIDYWRWWSHARMQQLFAEELTLRPGVERMLSRLHGAGVPMAIATNTERAVADPAIERIGQALFNHTVCGDEVPRGKPAPDIYLHAAKALGISIERCLVFEDSPAGMQAALSAGATVVGLPEHEEDLVAGAHSMRSICGDIHFDFSEAGELEYWHNALRLGS